MARGETRRGVQKPKREDPGAREPGQCIYIFFRGVRRARARDSETSRRQRDSQLVLCVSMRDTRMHGDVNSRLYVRSGTGEAVGKGEGEKERRRGEADYIGRH